jgi:hypothetical protein
MDARTKDRHLQVLIVAFSKGQNSLVLKIVIVGWRKVVDAQAIEDRVVSFGEKHFGAFGVHPHSDRLVPVDAFRIWREAALLFREVFSTGEALGKKRDRALEQVTFRQWSKVSLQRTRATRRLARGVARWARATQASAFHAFYRHLTGHKSSQSASKKLGELEQLREDMKRQKDLLNSAKAGQLLAEQRLREVREECRDLLALSTPTTAQMLLNDLNKAMSTSADGQTNPASSPPISPTKTVPALPFPDFIGSRAPSEVTMQGGTAPLTRRALGDNPAKARPMSVIARG